MRENTSPSATAALLVRAQQAIGRELAGFGLQHGVRQRPEVEDGAVRERLESYAVAGCRRSTSVGEDRLALWFDGSAQLPSTVPTDNANVSASASETGGSRAASDPSIVDDLHFDRIDGRLATGKPVASKYPRTT